MIRTIRQDAVFPAHDGADDTEIDLKAGAVQQHGLLLHQLRQFFLQLHVDVERAIEEA